MDRFRRQPQTRPDGTVAQRVAAELRERILKREIHGGARLRQDAIARDFGVGIIPVREALRQLELEGLVELQPHRGAVASELTLNKALEWLRMRSVIETDLIGLAMDDLRERDIDRASRVLERFDAALEGYFEIDRWCDLNWDFHSALYAPARKPETMRLLESLHRKCDVYIRLQLRAADRIHRAHIEHQALIELCRRRAKPQAKRLLRRHILAVGRDLQEVLSA